MQDSVSSQVAEWKARLKETAPADQDPQVDQWMARILAPGFKPTPPPEPVGFGEGFMTEGTGRRRNIGDFVGGVATVQDAQDWWKLVQAGNAGENATPDQKRRLDQWAEWTGRPKSFMGQVGGVLGETIAFGQEMMVGGLGLFGLGEKAAFKGIAPAVIKESLEKLARKGVAGRLAAAGFEGAAIGVATEVVTGGAGVKAEAYQRMFVSMAPQITVDEAGELDVLFTATARSFVDVLPAAVISRLVEPISERSGEGLLKLLPFERIKVAMGTVFGSWMAGGSNRTVSGFRKVIQKAGWNGVAGEMLEERYGDAMRAAAGVVLPEDFDGLEEMFPGWEQLAVEAVSFGVMGGAISGLDMALGKSGAETAPVAGEENAPEAPAPTSEKEPGGVSDTEEPLVSTTSGTKQPVVSAKASTEDAEELPDGGKVGKSSIDEPAPAEAPVSPVTPSEESTPSDTSGGANVTQEDAQEADWRQTPTYVAARKSKQPVTLLEHVKSFGGIDLRGLGTKNEAGDFAERLARKEQGARGFPAGVVHGFDSKAKKRGLAPEMMAQRLEEAGFVFDENSQPTSQLLEMLEDELSGTPTFHPDYVADIEQEVSQQGEQAPEPHPDAKDFLFPWEVQPSGDEHIDRIARAEGRATDRYKRVAPEDLSDAQKQATFRAKQSGLEVDWVEGMASGGVFVEPGRIAVSSKSDPMAIMEHEALHALVHASGGTTTGNWLDLYSKIHRLDAQGLRKARKAHREQWIAGSKLKGEEANKAYRAAHPRAIIRGEEGLATRAAELSAYMELLRRPGAKRHIQRLLRGDRAFGEKILDAIRSFINAISNAELRSSLQRRADEVSAALEALTGEEADFSEVSAQVAQLLVDAHKGAGEARGEVDPRFQTAYHGSGADFEKFSDDKIGTGEGAQAYGYGHYFADELAVAKSYSPRDLAYEEKLLSAYSRAEKAGNYDSMEVYEQAMLHDLEFELRERFTEPVYAEALDDVAALQKEHPAKIFKVDLAPSQEQYLLWDKPLSEQSELVREALSSVASLENGQFKQSLQPFEDTGGDALYRALSSDFTQQETDAGRVAHMLKGDSDKAASAALLNAGVRGIKYLDGTSRNRPLRQVKAEFLKELPENAEFAEVVEMAESGGFSPEGARVIKALDADGWLGFDYPAQAISAAMGTQAANFDISQETQDAIEALRGDSSFNYVIFDPKDVTIEARFAPRGKRNLTPDERAALSYETVQREESERALNQYHRKYDLDTTAAELRAARHEEDILDALKEDGALPGKTQTTARLRAYKKAVAKLFFHIDLKGKAAEEFETYKDKLTPLQIKLYEESQNLSPGLQKIADTLIDENQAIGKRAKKAGVIKDLVEFYVARIWKKETNSKGEYLPKFRKNAGARAKQRTLTSVLHGLAIGKELEVFDAVRAQELASKAVTQAEHDKGFIKELKAVNLLKRHSQLSPDEQGEWKQVMHPNFTDTVWAGQVDEGELRGSSFFQSEEGAVFEKVPLYAPKKLARKLNNILGTSSLYDIRGIETLTRLNALGKTTLLFTSLFHHQAFLRSFFFSIPFEKQTLKYHVPIVGQVAAYREGARVIRAQETEFRELVAGGLTVGKRQDFDPKTLAGWDAFSDVADRVGATAKFKEVVNAWWKRQSAFLFGHLGPNLKVMAALLEYQHLLRKNRAKLESGEKTREQLAEAAAELANNDFGGLNLRRLARSPTLQHGFRLAALAPDWTESNVRSMVKVFAKGDIGSVHRMLWVRVAVKAGLITLAWNYLMAGGDDEEFMENLKRSWDEGHLRWMEANVDPLAVGAKDGTHKWFSIIGHFRDPVKFITHPIRSAKHKSSILGGVIMEAMEGSDWAGRRFTTWEEFLGIDDKGLYKTTRRGKYRKGDKKGGKDAGSLVRWKFQGGPLELPEVPSFIMAQLKGVTPIQAQNLSGYLMGEMDAFDAFTKSLGLMTSTSHPKDDD